MVYEMQNWKDVKQLDWGEERGGGGDVVGVNGATACETYQ